MLYKKFNFEMTQYIKGIAVLLMIIHHLFWNISGYGIKINGIYVSQSIAVIGKACVSIFLILSGYGIFEGTKGNVNIKEFYIKRISKIYLNYILIVVTSSLIGILFFRNEFFNLIEPNLKGGIKLLLTFSGLQYFIGYKGFNPSWWFITCIITCYLLTPFIKKYIEIYSIKFLLLCFIISCVNFINIGKFTCILTIISWVFPSCINR